MFKIRSILAFCLILNSLVVVPAFSASKELKIMSYNVNSDRRVELFWDGNQYNKGFATDSHANWSFEKRLDRLMRHILAIKPDVALLQEMDPVSVQTMQRALELNEYTTLIQPYNLSNGAFPFIIAFNKDRFKLMSVMKRYFNSHPKSGTERPGNYEQLSAKEKEKFIEENLGEEFERSVQEVALEDKVTGQTILLFNNHFGLGRDYRLKSAELLTQFIKEFTKIVAGQKNSPIIIAGDFNAFPSDGGPEQIETLLKAGFKDLSKNAHFFDGKNEGTTASGTFCFYPYDFGIGKIPPQALKELISKIHTITNPEERRLLINTQVTNRSALGGKLDFILGTNSLKVKNSYVLLQPALEDIDFDLKKIGNETYDMYLKEFVKNMNALNIPAFPSDHFPLVTILDTNRNYEQAEL